MRMFYNDNIMNKFHKHKIDQKKPDTKDLKFQNQTT